MDCGGHLMYKQSIKDIEQHREAMKRSYWDKYFSIFYNNYVFEGDIEEEAIDFSKRQYWTKGTIAGFKVKNADLVYYAPYAPSFYNNYDYPTKLNLINLHNASFIPRKVMNVHKDVAIGFALASHKPIKAMCKYYIDKIVQIDMVLNTNLIVHKLPFMVGITPTDMAKAKNIVDKILNDEPVVFADLNDLSMVQVLLKSDSAPYICDKLYQLRISYENELLTLLGVDNATPNLSGERNTVDEVNANNNLININAESIIDNLNSFYEEIEKLFGVHVRVKKHETVQSVHEDGLGGVGTYEGNDGGKETQSEEA